MKQHLFEDWELKIMMDAIQQARCISIDEATEIRKRLLDLTSKRGRSRFLHLMQPVAGNVNVDEKIGTYIETMLEAMFTHRKIEFQYTELDEKLNKVLRRDGKKYVLNLYEIYWSDNNYYLIGAHDHHEGLTNYRLDRIENLEMSNEYIIDAREKIGDNPEVIIQKYIQESVNHFLGDSIRIEVEYEPNQVNNAILYDFAGSDIRVKKMKNGKCRAVFTKIDAVTLVGWFMQYANMFKVVGPEKFVDRVKNELDNAVKNYISE